MLLVLWIGGGTLWAQVGAPDVVRAETERCERRIREVKNEMLNKYESELGKLRLGFQKSADLESALAIREEERRVASERSLESSHFRGEPPSLKDLQESIYQKQSDLVGQVLAESLPRLVELKKQLTVAGRLDEAVEVKSAIVQMQNGTGPTQKLSSGAQVGAEEVIQAYQTNRERADKTYKGVRLSISGRVLGVRPDPRDGANATLVLSGGPDGAMVDCVFASGEYRVYQETQGQSVVVIVGSPSSKVPLLRVLRGGGVEITGKCDGWVDGGLRFSSCGVQKR